MTATLQPTAQCCIRDSPAVAMPSMVVFADDWGRHPSSCQHLVRRLLDRHEVHWVNTIGTRLPRLNWSAVARGMEKVRHWLGRSKSDLVAPKNLHVLNPKMWPWCGSVFGRFLNRKLLVRQLRPVLEGLATSPVAITTIPIIADVMDELPVRRWVYYCVDDFGQWPGLDQATLQRMEKKLVEQADTIIAVSEPLQERLRHMGRSSHLLTHGVDVDFWARSTDCVIPELQSLQPPLVVFWGVIDRRMDVSFVERLAGAMQAGTIVLAGPAADPDPALDRIPRVRRIGQLPMAKLPVLAQKAAVLIMPYADLPVTRAIQPLKLKEYLATGKPVVVRELPSTLSWSDCLDLAGTGESFVQAVRLRLETGIPALQQEARARLAEENWQTKAQVFERWVFG